MTTIRKTSPSFEETLNHTKKVTLAYKNSLNSPTKSREGGVALFSSIHPANGCRVSNLKPGIEVPFHAICAPSNDARN